MDEQNNAFLLAEAAEHLTRFDPSILISEQEMNHRLGITEDDLADYDEVDIE